jgi:hypothetical protein
MNYENLSKMVKWERQKAIYLLQIAEELGMDTNGYGELSVNPNSGYTYLWLDEFPFTLYMSIHCELTKNDVYVMYTDFNNGDEIEITLDDNTLDDLYRWVSSLEIREEE